MVASDTQHRSLFVVFSVGSMLPYILNICSSNKLQKFGFVFSICVLFSIQLAVAANLPVKIAVSSGSESIWKGESIPIKLVLLDSNNQASVVEQDWQIQLEVLTTSGPVFSRSVTIPSGSSSVDMDLELEHAGIYEVHARHDELLDGGLLLNIKNKRSSTRPTGTGSDSDDTRGDGDDINLQDLLAASTAPPVPVVFRSTPVRPILADGTDSTTISAMVTGENAIALHDIHIQLHNSGGELVPNKIIIPKGKFSGKAVLTSDHTGPVTVEYVSSIPAVQTVGDKTLLVDFRQPITAFTLESSPNTAVFAEKVELIASLVDANGTALATDRPRNISFAIEQGRGKLAQRETTIPVGSYEGRVTLYPAHIGKVVVRATSPELLSVNTSIDVNWPLAILLVSAVGGMFGGLITLLFGHGSVFRNGLVGLTSGFILYWAVVYGGLELITRGFTLSQNPLSAFIISAIAGGLVTSVLIPLLRK